MSRIDDLMADLRSEGTVHSQGGFTLDRDKAREKMRQFQLADPREYLLQLVRSAHCQGATRIDIEIDADDMQVRFDGATFTERDFEELYDALFGRADDPAIAGRRHLALGLNAALGLDPRRITVRSGAARLVVVPEEDDDFGPLDPPVDGTWIHARDRLRFSNVFRFFQGLSGSLPEAKLVADRCGFSATRIILNGAPLPNGRALIKAQVGAFHAVERQGCWAFGGPTLPGKPGIVHLIAGGVRVTTVEVAGAVGFVGAAGSARLQTDVSQADVIRDTTFEQVMACAREAQIGALEAIMAAGEADNFLNPMNFVDCWPSLQAAHGKAFAQEVIGRVSAPTLAGKTINLTDLDLTQPIEIITLDPTHPSWDFGRKSAGMPAYPAHLADLPVVPFKDAFAAGIADVKVDRTPELLAWVDRTIAEIAFRRRRVDALRLEGDFAVRTPIMVDAWQGEAGISQADEGLARITWVIDDCALSSARVDLEVRGLHVMIRGPLTPAADYRAPEHDGAFEAATLLIGDAVQRLMQALPHEAWGREVALRWLTFATAGHPRGLLVQRLRGEPKAGSSAWLQGLPTADDPLARMPLFSTMHGEHRTLAELAAQIAEHGAIDVVDPVVSGPALDPPILKAADAHQALLKVIFGSEHVRSGGKRLGDARKRAAFEALAPRPLDLSFETAQVVAEAAFDDGVIGLRRRAITIDKPGWFQAHVQPFSRGRPLRVVRLELPLPGIVGAVDVDDRALNATFDGLRDPVDHWRMADALIAHLDALFQVGVRMGPVRRFMRAILDLWVPTDAHHMAWRRWNDPAAYRAALRLWWHTESDELTAIEAALGTWSAADVSRSGPPDRLKEAILAPMFAASGSLVERFQAGYPRLSMMQVFRAVEGPGASIDDVTAGIEADGVVLHASRASVFPPDFGGVALKTEHAQLERLVRLVGPGAVARATTWKFENALARAVALAHKDPGGLPPATVGIVPIEAGEIGLPVPFEPDAPSAIQVVVAGRVVAVLDASTRIPIVGRVVGSDEVRVVLKRGVLAVDDLTRVRVIDQAQRAVDAAIRAAIAAPASPDRGAVLMGVLGVEARGVSQRRLQKNPRARALLTQPIFARLAGPPVSAHALIDQRRRRTPLWVTWDAEAPAPADPTHWVLVLDHATNATLGHLFSASIPDYAEQLAEQTALARMADRPTVPWALPDAVQVVEVSDGPIRALVGWGLATNSLLVLRDGRVLGETTLELGIEGVGGMVDDAALSPTPGWHGDPRMRRLQRLVASGVPQLGALLVETHPDAARALTWTLLRFAWPSREWVALYEWLHLKCLPDAAQRQYHDALQAAAQGTRYLLDAILAAFAGGCPCTPHTLMGTYGMPTGSGGDRILRAALGGDWPLVGDPTTDPLARLATQLGVLGSAPWIPRLKGGLMSMAQVAMASKTQRSSLLMKGDDRALLNAIFETSDRVRVAETSRQTEAIQRREADARAVTEAALRLAKIEQHRANAARSKADIERRRQIEEHRAAEACAQRALALAKRIQTPAPDLAAPEPAKPPPGPERPPEYALIDRVIARLTAVQADHPQLLTDVNLPRLSVRRDGALAWAGDHGFTININHPTAAAAMAGDAVAELMVAIAAYSALNLWLVDITDLHELQVVQHLLDLAARASNGEAART
ncbi:MAG: hypothetical protein ACI9U2_001306 [Bradymonadia bacterium]|jgi:hypothetical protein